MKKIYIAGFDVFCKDAKEKGEEMKAVCERYCFLGLYPLDNECSDSREIFEGNLKLIEQADIICANLNDFRGFEPDSGTAFEIGYGYAKGKALYGYRSDARSLRKRLGEFDSCGFSVEDFGMSVNLMIGCCCNVTEGSFEDCIAEIAKNEL